MLNLLRPIPPAAFFATLAWEYFLFLVVLPAAILASLNDLGARLPYSPSTFLAVAVLRGVLIGIIRKA